MARRKVTGSVKGRGRRITGLCGPSFGYRSAEDVIADIRGSIHEYYVREGPYESAVRGEHSGHTLKKQPGKPPWLLDGHTPGLSGFAEFRPPEPNLNQGGDRSYGKGE